MSYFQGFNELDSNLRSVLIGVLLIAPFWYVDIHLLSSWVMNDLRVDIAIVLSLVLSVCWLLLFTLVLAFGTNFGDKKSAQAELMVAVFSALFLGLFSFTAYLLKLTVLEFVIYSFGVAVLTGIILILRYQRKLKLKQPNRK